MLPGCTVQNQVATVPLAESNDEPVPALHLESPYIITQTFYPFYEKYGGVGSLGNPLTNVTTVDGWQVQYFEFGRLEYHPENEADYVVTVGWLGEVLNRRQPPIAPLNIPATTASHRRYYAKTGHTLSGDFLTYFDTHGGSVRFGLPISEPFLWRGQLTQDFQSARFFWTPDQQIPVTLEAIGKVHLNQLSP
jgi:hypothetical protein